MITNDTLYDTNDEALLKVGFEFVTDS